MIDAKEARKQSELQKQDCLKTYEDEIERVIEEIEADLNSSIKNSILEGDFRLRNNDYESIMMNNVHGSNLPKKGNEYYWVYEYVSDTIRTELRSLGYKFDNQGQLSW